MIPDVVTSRMIQAGERGVDFSFAKPPAARLVELGYTFFVGYVSELPSDPRKNLTPAEWFTYLDAGLAGLLVFEMSTTTANAGAPLGKVHGAHARKLVEPFGYVDEVAILVAVDTDTTPAVVAAQAGYVTAWQSAADHVAGSYGDVDIWEACRAVLAVGWIASAWAWSAKTRALMVARARAAGAHVVQENSYSLDGRWAVDPNECIRPFRAVSRRGDPIVIGGATMPTNAILMPTDAQALFYAILNEQGAALWVEWCGSGRDLVAMDALAEQRKYGAVDTPTVIANLKNAGLIGVLPEGDALHEWTCADFRSTSEPMIEIPAPFDATAILARLDEIEAAHAAVLAALTG